MDHESQTSMPILVSLVEDDPGTRESVSAVLKKSKHLHFVRAYSSAEEAIREMKSQAPDVGLVDINLPGMSGIECVAHLKRELPKTEFLMLTTYEDTDLIFNSLRAGASGYLLKRASSAELVDAIRQVREGGSPMSMPIARKLVNHFQAASPAASDMEKLTPREHEILSLLAKGFYYKEIAEKLSVSISTVRAHLHAVYGKLHVQSRTEAVIKFLER